MDIENTNQPLAPLEGSTQNQSLPSEDQPRQSKKLIIILGIIIVLLAFGVGGYILGLSNSRIIDKNQNNTVAVSPTNIQTENAVNSLNRLSYIFNGDLWTIDADGSNEKQLTHYGYNKNLMWSPSTLKIAYKSSPQSVVSKGKTYADCTNYHNIWIINSDGTEPIQVTNSEASRSEPSWSPDSNKIVFSENEKIIVYNLVSKSKKILATNAYYDKDPNRCGEGGGGGTSSVSWHPKENTILYNPGFGIDSKAQLIDAQDGKVLKTLDSFGAWSPDGTKIAYVEYGKGEPITQSIVVLTVADGKKEAFKPFMDSANSLYWSPDGKEILYHSFEDSVFGSPPLKMNTVHILTLATKADRNVSDKALRRFIEQRKDSGMQVGGSSTHGWSSDGKFIIVDVNTEEHRPQYAGINQINIVDAQTGEVIRTLKEARRTYGDVNEGKGYYNSISWSPK
ncbi:PD40 domain-containing protein [Candidatus Daviesbacteria bacterium]|nr:PD40 domain-containing protein [Candidatus Daviesbacteria bacterium]